MKTTNNKDNSIKFGDISLEYFHDKYAEVKLPAEYEDLFIAVSHIIRLKINKKYTLYGDNDDALIHVTFPLGKIKGWLWAHEYHQNINTSVDVEFSLAELTVKTNADNKVLRRNGIYIPGYFENEIVDNKFNDFKYLYGIVRGEHKEPTYGEIIKSLKISSQLPNRFDDGYGNKFELETKTKTVINYLTKIIKTIEELLDLTIEEVIEKGNFAKEYFNFTSRVWNGNRIFDRTYKTEEEVDKLIVGIAGAGWRADVALTKLLDDGIEGNINRELIEKKLKELGDK